MHPENKPNYSKFSGEIRISVFNLFSVAQPQRFGKKKQVMDKTREPISIKRWSREPAKGNNKFC